MPLIGHAWDTGYMVGGESCRVLVVHIGYMGGSADDASYEVCGWAFWWNL